MKSVIRLSELVGKEIVNIYNGARLGTVAESDLVIYAETGAIDSMIIPNKGNLINLWFERQNLTVPWSHVKKIGNEVLIVELDESHGKTRGYSY